MYKILCITDRKSCVEDFEEHIEKVSKSGVYGIILREKDLNECEYQTIAKTIIPLCKNTKLMLHFNVEVARNLHQKYVHISFEIFSQKPQIVEAFDVVGVSIHSQEEAVLAEKMGANYIIAGHIFDTDCKKNIPPRGIEFLRDICQRVKIPVYAIGGITPQNFKNVIEAGAFGVCLMSSMMKCENPKELVEKFK